MLEKVRLALRITTTAFDEEIQDLIVAALADLGIAGVSNEDESDPHYHTGCSYILQSKLWGG